MKHIIPLLVIFCLFASCSNTIKEEYRLIESSDRLRIPISDDVNLYTFAMHHYIDSTGVEYLTIENDKSNADYGTINFYRLDSCTLSKVVRVNRIGKDNIPGLMGHGVINMDEIIVSSAALSRLYKINGNGEILREYDFQYDGEDIHSVSMINSIYYTPLICAEGKIYGTQTLPLTRWDDQVGNAFEFDNSPVALIVDTLTGEYCVSKATYPELFIKDANIGKNENYSRIYDGERFVYSFAARSDIFYSKDLMGKFENVSAESKYIGQVKNLGYKRDLGPDESAFVLTEPFYGNILFDETNNVYYRFCFLKDDNSSDFNKREYLFCHGDFSIMILDENFKILGETKFEAGRYAPMLFFVNKDGLWLSENNYQRKDMTDDVLVFRCLKLKEK